MCSPRGPNGILDWGNLAFVVMELQWVRLVRHPKHSCFKGISRPQKLSPLSVSTTARRLLSWIMSERGGAQKVITRSHGRRGSCGFQYPPSAQTLPLSALTEFSSLVVTTLDSRSPSHRLLDSSIPECVLGKHGRNGVPSGAPGLHALLNYIC